MRVVIDPGHGGRDPGSIGPTGVQEKVVTLAVARQVAAILGQVADVKLTRYGDVALGPTISADLSARAGVANQISADVFISIHCNAVMDRTAAGTETYHYPGSAQGVRLADILQRRMVAALRLPNRGVKQARFAVLRETKTNIPAVLVELGFLSNLTEEGLLESPAFQAKAAQAIANGIAAYLGLSLPKTEHWAQPDLDWLLNTGIINTPRTPEQPVTWGEFAAVVRRIAERWPNK